MNAMIILGARVLLAVVFIFGAIGKFGPGYAQTQAYMNAFGVPASLLPAVIALELGAGMLLVVGWQTRFAAVSLAIFTVVAGVIFHSDFDDRMQMVMFIKNLAIAGGLLALTAHGAGAISLDSRRRRP